MRLFETGEIGTGWSEDEATGVTIDRNVEREQQVNAAVNHLAITRVVIAHRP